MDIAQYIADLLKVKDEVGVPSFGTFYTKPVSAFFDQKSNSFIPPGKQVFFKAEVADSSELINYISREKNLSRPSSKYFAEKFGETLKTEINLVGKAELHPLGSFEKVSEQFVFTPSQDYEHISSFGLLPVEEITPKSPQLRTTAEVNTASASLSENISHSATAIPDSHRSVVPEAKAGTSDEQAAATPEKRMAEARVDVDSIQRERHTFSPAPDETIGSAPKKSNGLMVAIVLFTVLLAAAIVAYFNYPDAFNVLTKDTTTAAIDTPAQPVTREKHVVDTLALSGTGFTTDSVEIDTTGLSQGAKLAADTISKATSDDRRNPQQELISFEIIGASLQTKKEAENYIRAMKAKGIVAKIVENKPGRYIKVSIGSFSDAAKRDAELVRIKKDVNKNAWPLDIKIKR